ncbi:MAG: DUF4231 domain-containing protein [Bacteroidales bacterium]
MEKNAEALLFFWFLIAITIAIFWIRSYLCIPRKKKSGATLVRRIDLFIKEKVIKQKYEITLNDIPNLELYLEGRVVDLIDWYELGSQVYKKRNTFIHVSTLILASGIPLLVVFNKLVNFSEDLVSFVSALLATLIAIANGVNEICLYQSRYIECRVVTEKLKSELALFLTSSDHYNITIENTDRSKLKEAYNSLIDVPKDYVYISFNAEQIVKAIRIVQFKEFVSRIEAIINSDCYKWSESVAKKK